MYVFLSFFKSIAIELSGYKESAFFWMHFIIIILLSLLLLPLSGPVTGILLKRFGCRLVGVAGSLILFVGLLTSVFTPSLHVLYVTYGFIGGK